MFYFFSASQIFEESYVKEGSKYFHTYSNKVFGGWDMCIEDDTAAKLQTMRIVKEIEVCGESSRKMGLIIFLLQFSCFVLLF